MNNFLFILLLVVLLLNVYVYSGVCFVLTNNNTLEAYQILGVINNSVIVSKDLNVVNYSINIINRTLDVVNYSINVVNKSLDVINYSVNIVNRTINVDNISVNVTTKKLEYIEYELYKKQIDSMDKILDEIKLMIYIVVGGVVLLVLKNVGVLRDVK